MKNCEEIEILEVIEESDELEMTQEMYEELTDGLEEGENYE